MTTMPCPECQTKSRVIKTKLVTDVFKETTLQCKNNACKLIFVAVTTPDRVLSPSNLPAKPA